MCCRYAVARKRLIPMLSRELRPRLMGVGLQNCSHNGFPVCTVVKDPITKEERWLFDGMILRSQLLVILSRRVRGTDS